MTVNINIKHAEVEIEEHEDGLNIYHLKVDTDYRRQGIGSKILNRVEKLARDKNKEYVVVNIKGGGDSIKFLQTNGYSIVETMNRSVTAEKEL